MKRVLMAIALCLSATGCANPTTKSAPTTQQYAQTETGGVGIFGPPPADESMHEVWPGKPQQVVDAVEQAAQAWNLSVNRGGADVLGGRVEVDSIAGNIQFLAERVDDSHTSVDISGSLKPQFKKEFIQKAREMLKNIVDENPAPTK